MMYFRSNVVTNCSVSRSVKCYFLLMKERTKKVQQFQRFYFVLVITSKFTNLLYSQSYYYKSIDNTKKILSNSMRNTINLHTTKCLSLSGNELKPHNSTTPIGQRYFFMKELKKSQNFYYSRNFHFRTDIIFYENIKYTIMSVCWLEIGTELAVRSNFLLLSYLLLSLDPYQISRRCREYIFLSLA